MNSYESLEALFNKDLQQDLNNEEFLQLQIKQLENEVMRINRNMGFLPTSKETEALPDLKFLAQITQCFREQQNLFDYNLQNIPEKREEIIQALFGQVTRAVLKTKIYNDKTIVQTADQLFENLVIWCTRQIANESPAQLQILSNIIDINVDYYKSNGREDRQLFPFGFSELNQYSDQHKEWVDSLKPGDKVDSLKQHLSRKFWCPAIVKCNDWSLTKLRFEQENCETYVYKKYLELQPYGSKKSEYQWRYDLKVGDLVDYYSYRTQWVLCKIVKVTKVEPNDDDDQNRVKFNLELHDKNEVESDDSFSTYMFAGNLEQANKFSGKQGDSFDFDDESFLKNQDKKRYAILRHSNSPTSSIYFVKYINLFGEMGGFDFVINVFSKKLQVNDYTLQSLMSIVRSSIESFVRPFVKEHGEILLQNLQTFLKQNSKENLRKIDKNNLKTVLDTINALVNRVYNKQQAQKICQKNEIDLALICLKSEFLEKQLFGSKILGNLERKIRNFDTQMDQKELAEILKNEQIFNIIIKGHPSLIQKGDTVIKTLFSLNEVSEQQLQDLWNQILKTDMESRNALLNLLKQTLNNFTLEQLLFFLDKMIESAHNITDQELFDVLFQLKQIGWSRFNNYEIVEKVNEVLWEIIQSKQDMKKEYMKEVIKSFVGVVKDHQNLTQLDKIIDNICRNENQIRNIKILTKLFKVESLQKPIFEKCKKKQLTKHIIDMVESLVVSKKRNEQDLIDENSFTENQRELIEKQLSFIQKLFRAQIQGCQIRFSEIEKIYKIFKENNFEYNFVYQWLLSYLVKEQDEGFAQKYQNFYDNNIEVLEKPNKENLVSFFWILMIKMNIDNKNLSKHTINLETNSLSTSYKKNKNFIVFNKEFSNFVGIDKLWQIYNSTQNINLEQKLSEHFAKLYTEPIPEIPYDKKLYKSEKKTLVDQCIQDINDQDVSKVRKACRILKLLILNEELFGFGNLKSWNYFKEDQKIGISYEKDSTYYYKEKNTLLIQKNKTLAQLKKRIANETSMNFRSIQLEQNDTINTKFAHLYNSLTLKELIDSDKRHFILKELELPQKEMAPILNQTRDGFSEKALAVFSEIFKEYSIDGKMSKSQLAQFTMKATDGTYCSEDDDRIKQVFKKYSTNDPDYLEEKGFVQFFLDSATHSEDKLSTVRYNIQSLGYDKTLTLKKVQNSENFLKKSQQTIRYKLAKNDEFFKILFNIIENDNQNGASDLIGFLTPNVNLIRQMIDDPVAKLKEDIGAKQWNYLCVILYQLMFKQERMSKLLESFDLNFNESERKMLFNKLYDTKFLELMMRKLQSLNQKDKQYMKLIYYPLKCLEGLFQIGIDFFRNDFIEDTMNFIAYSMKLKKLKMKEKNKDKQNTDTQTDVKSLQDYGPKEKDDKDKNRSNKDVENLLKLKANLRSSCQNIQEFLQQVSFQKFNQFLIQLLQLMLDDASMYNFGNKKNLTKTLVILLLSSLTLSPKNLKNLLNKDKGELKGLLFKGLTSQKSVNRLFFKNFYIYLTSNLQDFEHKRAFLRVIMSGIKETQENDEMHVLIELASNILNEISEMKQKKEKTELHEEFDFSKIFLEFSEKLFNYKTKENDFDTQEDNTLVAILTFMEKIIQADEFVLQEISEEKQTEIIQFLFKQCLFNIQKGRIDFNNIICKSSKSRQKAHELMTLIAIRNIKQTLLLLLRGFQPLAKLLPDINSYKAVSSGNSRKKQHSYTGLRNPGCICYMNAMLQQFYCIPTFRYGILMADDYKEEEPFQTQDMTIIDDNVFHQLQKMFAYLDFSQRQDFFPREFCTSYKDSSKQRVNVMVQQDAYEFLNMIFDKMETSLKPTPFQGIIDSVFMGRNCCVFTCQGCGFKRERLEVNYNLSLEVKHTENLEESFEKFIQKEIISDFMCDSCKKREDVTKQTFLKELPNVMVIHLQKIIFDLETLTNIKISSRYEFPQNLNLQKFVYKEEEQKRTEDDEEIEEKQPDDPEDYEYKLVGVVIHRGNAHFGHYISLINTNRKDPNRPDNTKDEWLEFDDSKISVFNMNNFEEECFGNKIENEYHQGMYNIEGNVSQSAYILVYDKLKKSKVKFSFKEENKNELDKVKNNLIQKDNFKFEDDILETDFYNIGIFLPQKYKSEIEQDNVNQLLENQLFSSNFTNTFAAMLYDSDLPNISVDMPVPDNLTEYQKTLAKMIIKVAPEYFVKVYCVAYQNYKIKKIAQVIESALMIRPECIVEFFQNFFFPNQMFLRYQLMQSMDSGIQHSINHLLTVSITILIRQFNLQMKFKTYDDPKDDRQHAVSILTFMIENFYLSQIKEFDQQKISRKTSYFFQSFKNICYLNPTVIEYLLQGNYLNQFRDLYLKQDPSNCRNSEHALTHLLQIIYYILQNVQQRIHDPNTNNQEQLLDYFNYFARPQLLFKIMKEDYRFNRYHALYQLAELICRDNYDNSFIVIKKSLKQLQMAGDLESIAYLEVLTNLLQIEDQYQDVRIKAILGIPNLNEQKNKENGHRVYIYGLSKESSLKRAVYKYLSPFGNEQGLIQGIFSHKDNNEVICLMYLYYVLVSGIQKQKILDYIVQLPPYNYISTNLFDWVQNYVSYNLKTMQKSYNAPKAELMYNYFQNLEDIVIDFEKRFKQILQDKYNYDQQQIENFQYYTTPEERELDCINENFIIGKTISSNLVQKKILYNSDDEEFSISVFLIKVSLMKNRTNGLQNLDMPKDIMSYESYIQKSQLKGVLKKFIGSQNQQYHGFDVEDESNEELRPLGIDSEDEDNDDDKSVKEQEEVVIKEEMTEEETNFFNKRYILRIAYSNSCRENFALQVRVNNNNNENFDNNEWIILAKAGKRDHQIVNLTLKNVNGNFEGLQISSRFLESEERSLQNCMDLVQTSFEEIYRLEKKEK